MKVFAVLSLIAVLSSPAVAEVSSSKESGKAFCAKMSGDQSLLKSASSGSKEVVSSSANVTK